VICGKDLKGQQQKYCSKDCQYYYQRKEGAMRKASREKREEKFFAENAKKDFSDVESFDIPDYKGTRYWDSMWRGNK